VPREALGLATGKKAPVCAAANLSRLTSAPAGDSEAGACTIIVTSFAMRQPKRCQATHYRFGKIDAEFSTWVRCVNRAQESPHNDRPQS